MIAVGGLLFLIGFCGCCGACKESKCLLIIYIIFSVLAFLIALAAGIIEAVYLNQINFYLTQAFTSLQADAFDGLYNSTSAVSQLWFNVMQYVSSRIFTSQSRFSGLYFLVCFWQIYASEKRLPGKCHQALKINFTIINCVSVQTPCCGIYGSTDFTSANVTTMAKLWLNNNRYTCAGQGQCFSNAEVPASCCVMNADSTVNPSCPQSGTGAYNTSCQSAFITPFANELHTYATIVMGVTFGLAAFCVSSRLQPEKCHQPSFYSTDSFFRQFYF